MYDKTTDFICLQIEKICNYLIKITVNYKIKLLADNEHPYEQVDILISKDQVLQI